MKAVLVWAVILVALLIAGFYALNHYVYQEKQGSSEESTPVVKQDEQSPNVSKDGLVVTKSEGMYVLYTVTVNSSGSCERSEYKMDYGDGKNDWFEVKTGECKPKTMQYSHTYSFAEPEKVFVARVHDLTNFQYHEPAFDTVENPIFTVGVKLIRP